MFFFFLLNFCNHGVAVFPAISRGGGFLFPFPFRGVVVGGWAGSISNRGCSSKLLPLFDMLPVRVNIEGFSGGF